MIFAPWQEDDEDDSFAYIKFGRMPQLGPLEAKEYLLSEGVRCQDWFPADFILDLEKTRGVKLTDSIPNTNEFLVVSEPLKVFLEAQTLQEPIEFLPLRIRNHQKKLVPQPYFVANVLRTIACLDKAKSEFVMNTIIKDQVSDFMRCELNPAAIPPDARLFRLEEKRSLILVREDLARAISKQFNGMKFVPLEYYGAEFRSS